MNPQPASDDPESSSVASGAGVGRRLKLAREARGLGTERIATLLHLHPALVERLEQDRYADLPEAVFIAGYIRNYARHVGLDPESLVAAYRAAEGAQQTDRGWSEGHAARPSGGNPVLVRLVSLVVIVGLGYLFAQWWQGRVPEEPDPTLVGSPAPAFVAEGPAPPREAPAPPHSRSLGTEAGSPGPLPPVAEPQTVGGAAGGGPARDVNAASPPNQAPHKVAATPAPSASGTTAQPDNAPPGAVSVAEGPQATAAHAGDPGVVLDFKGNCWVDIRDATKTFSLKGEMSKGDRRVLGGTPPYEMKLGNAAAVAITVNGTPFDLSRVARTNSPRFKLDPAKLP